jgi:hypothetical protein
VILYGKYLWANNRIVIIDYKHRSRMYWLNQATL